MIVYCDATECKNNKDGECNNRFRTGVQASFKQTEKEDKGENR